MIESQTLPDDKITRPVLTSDPKRLLLGTVLAALVLGVATGYILSTKAGSGTGSSPLSIPGTPPKSAQQDSATFRDFAIGVIRPKPSNSGAYSEGSEVLERDGAVPVALTSSVVDLSKYEGKKVKVYGETQKAENAGWLMDVGKVEEMK